MFNTYTAFLALFFFFFSFFEIIIFNEEIFLAICFIIFVFACYAFFNAAFSTFFQERSNGFGRDIFFSFNWHFRVLYLNLLDNLHCNYLPKINNDFILFGLGANITNILNCVFSSNVHYSYQLIFSFTNLNEYRYFEYKTFLKARENHTLIILFSQIFLHCEMHLKYASYCPKI